MQSSPFWLRSPWPLSLAIACLAGLWMALAGSPLDGFDRTGTDTFLRLRLRAGMSPRPDPNVFLIGIGQEDLKSISGIAAEYQTYAEIIDIASDLGAAVTAFDLILARGGPAEAETVLAAARRSRAVVFAAADTGEKEILRSFPWAASQSPAGLINMKPDRDGVVRGYEYARTGPEKCLPSLALAAWLAAGGVLGDLTCSPPGFVTWPELMPDRKTLTNRSIPVSVATLNYRSGFTDPWDKGFKYASLADLRRKYSAWKRTAGAIPADLPGPGSLVLVGPVAPGLGDSGPSPFGINEPKVQVQATALNDLVQGELLRSVGLAWQIGIIALLVVAFTFGGAIANGFTRLCILWLGLGAAPLAMGFFALIRLRTVYPAITPAVLITLCFVAEGARRWGLASVERLRMRTTMAMYFSPRVMEEVLRNPGALEPREAELTVLLTDLRNFTTITERFGTPVVFDLMNKVFEIETRAVIATDGSMEHFLGDQFLGYWGAPREQPDACERAMKAGRLIIEGLDELHRSLPAELAPSFGFGLAIHKGKALVGNKGSRFRFDYGILGDIVNTAARAESLTKLYGVRWIVTPAVLGAQSRQAHRFLDRVRVKGRSNSVELLEVPVNPKDTWPAIASGYRNAWLDYQAGRFAEALLQFEKLAVATGDPPSKVLAERCREFIAAPPAGWDGAYTLREK
jgi:adenylate cyclase